MTTVELAQLAIPNTRIKDIAGATPEDAQSLIRAINEGIGKFYSKAPSRWSRTGASHYIAAPQSVSCSMTNGSRTVSNTPFTAGMRGCTVKLDGSDTYNEIVSTDQVLHAWTGATGTVSGTVYFDTVAITDFAVRRMVTDPVVVEMDRRLTRQEGFDSETFHYPFRWGSGPMRVRSTASYPTFYRTFYVGGSYTPESADAVFMVRVDPMPLQVFNLAFDLEVRPATYRIGALVTASDIPVDDTLCYDKLLPMVEAALVRTPIWAGDPQKTRIALEAGAAAEVAVETELQRTFTKTRRRVRTQDGW